MAKNAKTATTGKAGLVAKIEKAMKVAEENRAVLEKLYKEKNMVASDGPWEHLHRLGLWTPEKMAQTFEDIKAGKSTLDLADQIYVREMLKGVEKEEEAE